MKWECVPVTGGRVCGKIGSSVVSGSSGTIRWLLGCEVSVESAVSSGVGVGVGYGA